LGLRRRQSLGRRIFRSINGMPVSGEENERNAYGSDWGAGKRVKVDMLYVLGGIDSRGWQKKGHSREKNSLASGDAVRKKTLQVPTMLPLGVKLPNQLITKKTVTFRCYQGVFRVSVVGVSQRGGRAKERSETERYGRKGATTENAISLLSV